ncbi:hypothetical protein V8C44DRAFT_314417 [Trichoderma aethiopicum]
MIELVGYLLMRYGLSCCWFWCLVPCRVCLTCLLYRHVNTKSPTNKYTKATTFALQGHSCSPEVPDIISSNHQQPAKCRRVCDQGGVFSSWR